MRQGTNAKKRKANSKNPNITIIMLNTCGLNAPIKSHRLPNWVNKQNLSICRL